MKTIKVKILIAVVLICSVSFALVGCGKQSDTIDMIKMNSQMAEAQALSINETPKNYVGKTILAEGRYNTNHGVNYIYIKCVSCPLDVPLRIEYTSYPSLDKKIKIEGVFKKHDSGSYYYIEVSSLTTIGG